MANQHLDVLGGFVGMLQKMVSKSLVRNVVMANITHDNSFWALLLSVVCSFVAVYQLKAKWAFILVVRSL